MRYREQYPSVSVTLTPEERASLYDAAVGHGGYGKPSSQEKRERRGRVKVGGYVRLLLDKVWPWLEQQKLAASQCDISPEHAWLLAELRSLRERDESKWARVMALAAEGAHPPAELERELRRILEAAPRAASRGERTRGHG